MNKNLKRAIDYLYKLCSPEDNENTEAKQNSIEREVLKSEFVNYIAYLSSSDGIIAPFETSFLSTYFDYSTTPTELSKYIENNNIYTTTFEKSVPKTLISFIERDNSTYKANGKLSTSISKTYCDIFECIGKEFLVCDGEATEAEVADMTIYLTMLRNYREENYSGPQAASCAIDIHTIHAGEIIPHINSNGDIEKSLDDYLEELDGLVGLESVKREVSSLVHLQEIKQLRKSRGLKDIPMSNHLVFYGNPGTGKTTVARLIAKIYHSMGILSQGQCIEVDRAGLVAGYVGQTALKVHDVVKTALGGVLFIDEAYTLTYSSNANDYGQEAVDTLLKEMEDNRGDFIVIVAGYPELMEKFIDSNPGLRSRFNKYINFVDYNVDELVQIYNVMCQNAGYTTSKDALAYVKNTFESKYRNHGKNFANAREVRNYFEDVVVRQANRLYKIENPSNEDLCTLSLDDVMES